MVLENGRVAERPRRAPARGVGSEMVLAAKGGGKVAPVERLLDGLQPLREVGVAERRGKGGGKVVEKTLLLGYAERRRQRRIVGAP